MQLSLETAKFEFLCDLIYLPVRQGALIIII